MQLLPARRTDRFPDSGRGSGADGIAASAGRVLLRGMGRPLSRVGLGSWALGGQGWRYSWGRQDDALSLRTIDTALDLGIDWIDTAPVYGVGHAEELVGRAIRGRRERVAVATKCGFLWEPGSRRPFPRLTAASVFGELEASLRRLGTDYVDLYQIHWPGPNCDLEGGWESIGRLVEQGKVRCGGVCNLSAAELKALSASHASPTTLQLPCSLVEPLSPTVANEAERCGAHLLGYSPLASGRLCSGFDARRVASLPGDDWRVSHPSFRGEASLSLEPLVRSLASVGTSAGHSVEELALSWALARVGDEGAVLLGGRSPDQLTRSAGGRVVAPEVLAKLDVALDPQ